MNARQTCSRGAPNTRSIRMDRSEGVVTRAGSPGSPGSLAAPVTPRRASADSSCITARMLPAGSLNQAMGGPSPRATPVASCENPA